MYRQSLGMYRPKVNVMQNYFFQKHDHTNGQGNIYFLNIKHYILFCTVNRELGFREILFYYRNTLSDNFKICSNNFRIPGYPINIKSRKYVLGNTSCFTQFQVAAAVIVC